MIGKTERDPVIQGNNEPSGRFNLKGQQKPQYLIDAIETEKKVVELMEWVTNAYELHPSSISLSILQLANDFYGRVYIIKQEAYTRWHEEQSNENN